MRRNPRQHGRRAAAGFTLVELVLVMLIVGIIAAIAAPRFAQASARQQLAAAAKRVESDLEKARQQARASSNWVTVRFNAGANSYQYAPQVGGNTYTVQLNEAPYEVTLDAAKFGNGSNVSFNGFGFPSNAGKVALKSGAGTVVVTLDASGRVSR